MKHLLLFLSLMSALKADTNTLQTYLNAVTSSPAAKTIIAQTSSENAKERIQGQSTGFFLNGELDYAAEKNSNRDAVEFHVSVEKQLILGDGDRYVDALGFSYENRKHFKVNQLKALVYEHYIDTCTYKEKAGLLEDAKERNIKLTQLIDEGVKGGEFDRSALLRSEVVVQKLQLRIRALHARYYEALQQLRLFTDKEGEPLCQDLPYGVTAIEDIESNALLYQYLKSEISTAQALENFQGTTLQNITVGVGYDNEIDLSRALLFMQIPLSKGSRQESAYEAAIEAKMAAQERLAFTKKQLQTQILAYTNTQDIRQENLKRLNDILIPKAYETSELLLARFMGSEGSYLAYIDSQTTLFDLLMQGIDTHADALRAEAKLYQTLGINPLKETK